jgi:hypothetical protein
MLKPNWRAVRSSAPCPVCGKPDWCTVTTDGRGAHCRRVQSSRPMKNGGWFHVIKDGAAAIAAIAVSQQPARAAARHDLHLLARSFSSAINPERLLRFAAQLQVSVQSLERLGVGWSIDRNAWAFPMLDASMHVRGIRMRTPAGRKFAITGGREGLFIPRDLAGPKIFVCEGPTDTAALLDLGLAAIGRPSCLGGVQLIVELLQARHAAGETVTQLVIVADGDTPGQRGAEQLAGVARIYCPIVQVITPPTGIKDARAWKHAGATAADVQRAVWAAPLRQIRVVSSVEGASR